MLWYDRNERKEHDGGASETKHILVKVKVKRAVVERALWRFTAILMVK